MELNRLIPLKFIPDIGCDWVVRGKYLMYKKIEHIPVAFIENDIVYVFLDNRIPRQILKITKWILDNHNIEFYFTTPELSSPKYQMNYYDIVKHYLFSYTQEHFFEEFEKIGFDLIKNMVDWCIKNNCTEIIKECYDDINKKVQKGHYDYWSNKTEYNYNQKIREDFSTLYRDIQINQIL